MILNVKDVRVGNLIHNDVQDIDFEVNMVVMNRLAYGDCVGYSPIPLTDKDVKQYGHFNLIKVNDDYFVCFGNYKTQVKFYHELQNYYYLVNHEEL